MLFVTLTVHKAGGTGHMPPSVQSTWKLRLLPMNGLKLGHWGAYREGGGWRCGSGGAGGHS